jgi:hypothetical protein
VSYDTTQHTGRNIIERGIAVLKQRRTLVVEVLLEP